jgi:Chaperonin GroEL (HSP60 family)
MGGFFRKVDVDHPAAKSVIDAVNTVDTHVGDGTSSASILIGSLLGNAKKLLNWGFQLQP